LKLGSSRFEGGVTTTRTQHPIIKVITTLQLILQWTPLRQFKYLENDITVVFVLLSSQQQQESVDPMGTGGCMNTELQLYYCSTVIATYGSGCFVVKRTAPICYSVVSYC